jgi:hypothetical protein
MMDPTEGTVLKEHPGNADAIIAEEREEQDVMSPATESPDVRQGDMEMEMEMDEEDSPDQEARLEGINEQMDMSGSRQSAMEDE